MKDNKHPQLPSTAPERAPVNMMNAVHCTLGSMNRCTKLHPTLLIELPMLAKAQLPYFLATQKTFLIQYVHASL